MRLERQGRLGIQFPGQVVKDQGGYLLTGDLGVLGMRALSCSVSDHTAKARQEGEYPRETANFPRRKRRARWSRALTAGMLSARDSPISRFEIPSRSLETITALSTGGSSSRASRISRCSSCFSRRTSSSFPQLNTGLT